MAAGKRTLIIALAGSLVAGLASTGGLYGTGGTVLADTLLITSVNAAEPTATERPKHGSSMTSVEAHFGPPATRGKAVGQPPITRWDYPTFSVYFEYDHVVHAVAAKPH